MRQVDDELSKICGLTHRDLADFAYDDECEPEEVGHLSARAISQSR
jgi:hypothetical protein